MTLRFHKFVLALCVTGCLAVALWPRERPEPASAAAPELDSSRLPATAREHPLLLPPPAPPQPD